MFVHVQLLLDCWFYRRAVDALVKGGMKINGTYELWLIEEIKAAQAAVGVDDDYPDWKHVPLLKIMPSFGLDTTPPSLLPGATEGLGERLLCGLPGLPAGLCWKTFCVLQSSSALLLLG